MKFVKCPRCEINYLMDGEKICSVCRKNVHGETESDDLTEMCSECGERPAVPGGELCAVCLKEMSRRDDGTPEEETLNAGSSMPLDSVSGMDEIDLDIPPEMDGEDFQDDEYKDEDAEDDESETSLDAMSEKELADDPEEDDE